ncbi:MAG: hypothetical protein P1U42_06560 [Phycisphaerales bacterium]|nr:hypothetical protein [Phycisphaerales bacterium]
MLNNLIEFVARTHLVVLHFPIALIISAAIVDSSRLLYSKLSGKSIGDHFHPSNTASVMFIFAFASTLVAIATGLVLGFDYGKSADLHRTLGIVSGALILITAIALLIARKNSGTKSALVYLVFLCVSALGVSITGHLGGNLTHGEGFLTDPIKQLFSTQPEPEPEQLTVEQVAQQAQELNITIAAFETYRSEIQPLLDYSCIKCHGEKKQKGDVRLDTVAFTLDVDAAMIERGDPDASEIIYRVELPSNDDDAMPPLNESHPFTPSQIESVRDWISSLTP